MNLNKGSEVKQESFTGRYTSQYLKSTQSYPSYQNYSKPDLDKPYQEQVKPYSQGAKYNFQGSVITQQTRTRNYYFDRRANQGGETKYLKYQYNKSPNSKNNVQESSTYERYKQTQKIKTYQPFFGYRNQQTNQNQFKKAVSTGYGQNNQTIYNSPNTDKATQKKQNSSQQYYQKPQYLSYSSVAESESIQTLKKQLKNSLESYGALQQLLSKQQNENIKLTQKINTLQSKQLQLQSTLNALQEKKTDYWKNFMNKQSECKTLQERINNLNNISVLHQNQKQAIEKKFQYSNIIFKQLEEENAHGKSQNGKLQKELTEMKKLLNEDKSNYEKLEQQKKDIQLELQKKQKINKQLEAKVVSVNQKNKTIEQALKDALTKYEGTTVPKSQLQVISSNYDQKILSLSKDKESLYKAIMKMQLENEQLQQSLKKSKKQIQAYEKNQEKQYQQIEMEKKKLKSYQQVLSKQKEQFEQQLRKKILEIEQDQAVKNRQYFEKYMEEKQNIEKQNVQLHVKIEEIKHEQQQLKKQLDVRTTSISQLTLKNQQLTKELAKQKQIIQNQNKTIKKLQEQYMNIRTLAESKQSQQTNLKQNQAMMNQKCEQLTIKIKRMEQEKATSAIQFQKIKQNLNETTKQLQRKTSQYKQRTQELQNIKVQYEEKLETQLKQFELQLKYLQIQDKSATIDQKYDNLKCQLQIAKDNNKQLQKKLISQGKHQQQLINQLQIGQKNYYDSISNFEKCYNSKLTINENKLSIIQQYMKTILKNIKSDHNKQQIQQFENAILTLQEENCLLRKQIDAKIKSLIKVTQQKAELIKYFQSKSYEHSEKSHHQKGKKKLIRRDKAKLKLIENQDGTVDQGEEHHKHYEDQAQTRQRELQDQIQKKQFLISELKKSLQSYAQMVQSLQHKNQDLEQVLEQNDIIIDYYKEILDVFNITWDEETAQPPQEQLIMSINTFTKRIQSLMSSLNSLEEQLSKVTQQNAKIKSEQQSILKKCQFMISTAEKENDQLVAKCSKLYHKLGMADEHIAGLQKLVWQYNEQITVVKVKLLNLTLVHKNCENQQQYQIVSKEDQQSQSQKYSQKHSIQNCQVDEINEKIYKAKLTENSNENDNTETLAPLSPATFADKTIKKNTLEVRSPRSKTTKIQKKQSKKQIRK